MRNGKQIFQWSAKGDKGLGAWGYAISKNWFSKLGGEPIIRQDDFSLPTPVFPIDIDPE